MPPDQARGFRPYVPDVGCGGRGGIGKVQVAGFERGGVGAVEGDGAAKFVPGGGVHLLGDDAKIDADVEEDGADLAVAVLGDDLGVHLLLGGGEAVEGGIVGRPTRWDGPPSGNARRAWAGPTPPGPGLLRSRIRQEEGGQRREPSAQPGLKRGGAEQTADHVDGDEGGIGGVEDPGEDGKPGESVGVVGLAQRLDDVSAVGDQGVEEAEDPAGASGVEARGNGPIGIGVRRLGWCGGGVGHGSH